MMRTASPDPPDRTDCPRDVGGVCDGERALHGGPLLDLGGVPPLAVLCLTFALLLTTVRGCNAGFGLGGNRAWKSSTLALITHTR